MKNLKAPGKRIDVTAPIALLSGDPFVVGFLALVATVDCLINVATTGGTDEVYELTVYGHNGSQNTAVNPGDKIYCDNAQATVTDRLTVDSSKTPYGIALGVVNAGSKTAIHVKVTGGVMDATPDSALLKASNLSDLASKPTARTNLGGGANKIVMSMDGVNLVGATAQVFRKISPVAGTIKKVYSSLQGALTTGDAILTGKIGANAITNGVVTITQNGCAAGDKDEATPTAANVVAVGDEISFTVSGTNDAAVTANLTIEIEPSA